MLPTEVTGKGLGVRWEGLILTQALYEDLSHNKSRFIPVLFEGSSLMAIPIALRSFSYFKGSITCFSPGNNENKRENDKSLQ